MDDSESMDAFEAAVIRIARLELDDSEKILSTYADKESVTALTLLAELAWTKCLMSEDSEELKEAMSRLDRAEHRALKVCDSARGTMLGSLFKMATSRHKNEPTEKELIQEVVDCTNLAYLYLMQALACFRGTSKNYIQGAFKLKASWRLYKYLSEHEAQFQSSLSSPGTQPTKLDLLGSKKKVFVRPKWRILSEFAVALGQSTSSSGPAACIKPVNNDSDDELAAAEVEASQISKKEEESDEDDAFFDANSSTLSQGTGEDEAEKEDCHELLPSSVIGDIYYGLGGFHFFVSMVPTGYKWIVESLGFRGDREAGRKELQECVNRRGHRAASAMLLLLWMDTFFYKDRQNAERMLLQAEELFEEGGKKPSPLFRYLGGYLARVQGHMETAIVRFEAAKAASKQVHVLQQMCDYEIGWCYYLQNQFPRCIQYFEPFMKEFKAPSYKAYCAYQLGCALDIVGRPAESRPYMAMVHKFVRKNYTFDSYAARKAAQWLKNGRMSDFDKVMLEVFNTLEIKMFADAFEPLARARHMLTVMPARTVRQLLPFGVEVKAMTAVQESGADTSLTDVMVTNDSTALYVYCLGRALRGVGRLSEAMECYHRVISNEAVVKEETYIVPYTYCEVGELLLKEGRFVEAKQNLRAAKTRFQNYDFDKPLGRRLKLAFDLVKEGKKETADFLKHSHEATPPTL